MDNWQQHMQKLRQQALAAEAAAAGKSRGENQLRGIGMTSARTRLRLVAQLKELGIRNQRALDLIEHLPRHLFVDEAFEQRAYENEALPIGFGQTISQPYTVAKMTELVLAAPKCQKVLEIGAGCGYQSAVLSQVAERVFSIEYLQPLYAKTKPRLQRLGFSNVELRQGDGYQGWPEQAPFDVILAAAAPPELPAALLKQLKIGGRLIAPEGPQGQQVLVVIDRTARGYQRQEIEPVTFVPLVNSAAGVAQ